ncbi:ncam-related adhesion molecule [Plakobranchus ocellatus]|uniref:Ncam-related adhesion molecule n=1 Tax=Plakobranchus ocellatus TaxID=259542 RepID=A0AAV4BFB1_9GAST|nr:ncam-related adhesion molecule [Plakobranchus ocellatus]
MLATMFVLVPLLLPAPAQSTKPFTVKINSRWTTNVWFDSGKSVRFPCNYTGQKPIFRWYHNDVEITDTIVTDARISTYMASDGESFLDIDNIKYEDAGTIKCVGELNGYSDSAELKFEVYEPMTLKADAIQYGELGRNAEIDCKTAERSGPTGRIWSFKNHTTIPQSEKFDFSGSKLLITPMMDEDLTDYICQVYNRETNRVNRFRITLRCWMSTIY